MRFFAFLTLLVVLSGCKSISIIYLPEHNVKVSGSVLIFDGLIVKVRLI